jgi:hypothetical protein
MNPILQEITHRQRSKIAAILHRPLSVLAERCAAVWPQRESLNQILLEHFDHIPHCSNLFVFDCAGIQQSDSVSGDRVVAGHFGRDHSECPYMQESIPPWGFLLSDSYVSRISHRPSLTALHLLESASHEPLGYVGACFDLRNLPTTGTLYSEPDHWRQIKGDPSIRRFLFQQARVESPMDRNIDQALSILEELLNERGIFQCVIHFSSSRATVWSVDDPFRYHILDQEALADPDVCLAYPRKPYSSQALVPPDRVWPILRTMRELRLRDETLYLRSTSFNLFNGMISLTFSCDGSHYMRYDEFLERSLAFWFGDSGASEADTALSRIA